MVHAHALPPAARQAFETMATRLRSFRHAAEKAADRATVLGVSGVTALGMGYVNERFGEAPASDPGGMKEYTLAKVPVDMAIGAGAVVGTFLNAFGRYDLLGLSIATGSTNSVLYRMGAEFARKHPAQAKAGTKTAGEFGPGARQSMPWAPRQPHEAYT